MKTLVTFFVLLVAANNTLLSQEPTYAGLPDSSHVLVVYNSRSQNSIDIMNYYKNARGIPESNIVELTELDTLVSITDPLYGTTHTIELQQGLENDKEIIRDATILSYNPVNRHAWLYFVDRIAAPIAEKLRTTFVNGTPLKDIIRFIVLCKGVPFRIMTKPDDSESCNQNVPVDGLLCFLGEDINDPYHLMDYLNMVGAENEQCRETFDIDNPYYNADPNFTMDHMFLPNHYNGTAIIHGQQKNITLSYLITHLDGMSLNDVENMIDSSIAAINSSGYDWFIDADPTPCHGDSQILYPTDTKNTFVALGMANYFIDETETVYFSNPSNKPVMSYGSNGKHTDPDNNCVPYFNPNYIQSQLTFTYAPGAIFNTAESFNVNTLGTDPIVRRDDQGQIPEFFHMGGTVGVGQVLHGTNGGIILNNSVMLPAYTLGYTFIEAAYLAMNYLTDNRVVVGDPLTRIALPCQRIIITSDTTISSAQFTCGFEVPEGKTLTIAPGAVVDFNVNSDINLKGNLVVSENSVLNFNNLGSLNSQGSTNIIVASTGELNFVQYSRFSVLDSCSFTGKLNAANESVISVVGSLVLTEGAQFDFSEEASININGSFYSFGSLSNRNVLTFNNSWKSI